MPCDIRNRYFVPGAYNDRTISPTPRYPHIRTRNSTRVAPVPYPTPETLMTHVDNPHGNEWYRDPSEDLYLRDLLFVIACKRPDGWRSEPVDSLGGIECWTV